VKVVLGKSPHESVSTKQEGKNIQDRALARPVRSHEYGLSLTEIDQSVLYPSEVFDSQLSNPHADLPVLSYKQFTFNIGLSA